MVQLYNHKDWCMRKLCARIYERYGTFGGYLVIACEVPYFLRKRLSCHQSINRALSTDVWIAPSHFVVYIFWGYAVLCSLCLTGKYTIDNMSGCGLWNLSWAKQDNKFHKLGPRVLVYLYKKYYLYKLLFTFKICVGSLYWVRSIKIAIWRLHGIVSFWSW